MTITEKTLETKDVEVLIIGAGAAGLMCAAVAGKNKRNVLVIDHANKAGKKILMSGGGRCNFTNTNTQANNFISRNPNFCKSALSRYTPYDFIALVEKYNIPYHEKKLGQLFCNNKAKDILDMLLNECRLSKAAIRTKCSVEKITFLSPGYQVLTSQGSYNCESLVIASGGLSIPTMGATGIGYQIAKQFDIEVIPTQAALVPFTISKHILEKLSVLSGNSLEVSVSCNGTVFDEHLLFTHRGVSGPAILQISSYWKSGDTVTINLLPNIDLQEVLLNEKTSGSKAKLKTSLAKYMSKAIAQHLLELWFPDNEIHNKAINQFTDAKLSEIAQHFHQWLFKPQSTEGYRTAEVTLGGVNCDEISSKTMQANKQPGLYFIGEVLDVTGHLGGYNFQWAWASAVAAGQVV